MSIVPNNFRHKNPFTIGVEEEYMLCHPESGELKDRADEIMVGATCPLKVEMSAFDRSKEIHRLVSGVKQVKENSI